MEDRARQSRGTSDAAIHSVVAEMLRDRHAGGGVLLDVGCGTGAFREHARECCDAYIGADAVRYDEFPEDAEFRLVNLDAGRVDLPDGSADVVVCIETIEHVENPRALMRELGRLSRPGGLIVVSTPNQTSLLSKLCLVVKNQFVAFQERPGLYPAHISALLPMDLLRIARELNWVDSELRFSGSGRVPGTRRHWPPPLGGRSFSDNVVLAASRPF